MRPNCSSWVQSGIDLKITPDDEVYCFEVNPSPAFSYYESNTGQPISAAIARALTKANVASHQPPAGWMDGSAQRRIQRYDASECSAAVIRRILLTAKHKLYASHTQGLRLQRELRPEGSRTHPME
jgi:hypothetical protein